MAKKKTKYDQTIKKVEGITSKVNVIMKNRLIIALFLIIDGITFLLNPNSSLPEMARNIIILIVLAAFSIFITNLASKTKDKKTIAISAIIIIAGVIFYIFPDFIAAYMQLLLALFVIYDGLSNIANVLHLNKMSKFTQAIARKYDQLFGSKKLSKKEQEKRERFKDIDKNINDGLEQQGEKMLNPLKDIVDKSSKSTALYVVTNAASVILGIILLVFPDVSMAIWGAIFLYTGFSNLLIAARNMDLKRKLKEKKYKEILFDADKSSKPKSKRNSKTKSKKP